MLLLVAAASCCVPTWQGAPTTRWHNDTRGCVMCNFRWCAGVTTCGMETAAPRQTASSCVCNPRTRTPPHAHSCQHLLKTTTGPNHDQAESVSQSTDCNQGCNRRDNLRSHTTTAHHAADNWLLLPQSRAPAQPRGTSCTAQDTSTLSGAHPLTAGTTKMRA